MPCPRLIEVALPIREISAESVRDKSLRHGHISTLHLWWARRPLAACRAIVFASLVPDPDHPECPAEFRRAVETMLRDQVPEILQGYYRGRKYKRDRDPYRPYDGIADTPRNRLLTFIAKWSPESLAFEEGKRDKEPPAKLLLDDRSLIKWETSDPENEQGRAVLHVGRHLIRAACNGETPAVLDPFAGGGAIPLEAGRLGCQAIANDYNPVAYLILRATCEFPQKYGRPGIRENEHGVEIEIPNVLVHDVEKWARWAIGRAREQIGHLYPPGEDGRPVVGTIWARTVPCANPTCRGTIPLLRSMYLCNKKGKRVALTMDVDKEQKTIRFGIAKGKAIRRTDGTKRAHGPAVCPFCEQPTTTEADVRAAGCDGRMGEQMVAVIVSGKCGKDYRSVEPTDLEAFEAACSVEVERPGELILPEIYGAREDESTANSTGIRVHRHGMHTWGSLYNPRQLVAMQTFLSCLREALALVAEETQDEGYRSAVGLYLALWLSRNAMRMSSVGRWAVDRETFQTPFDGARLPMKCDYVEANPFSEVTGGFANQLDWIVKVLLRESGQGEPGTVSCGDSASLGLADGSVHAVVTDPPYFDEAAYADLSDFFYVWLKRAAGDLAPEALLTPQTPKSEEATALKHRHGGDGAKADSHFTRKLTEVFAEARRVCKEDGLFAVIFAHQETQAWVALVNSLFAAGLTIDATWPIEMELKNRMRGLDSAALETSINVICRPRVAGSAASFRTVRREIERAVHGAVKRFWAYGFRGADLIVACYGPAVGVFGGYERVERADGTPVGVPELLALARTSAREAIAGEFQGDSLSTLYYVWANLYGTGEQAWDDARLVVMLGSESEDAMEVARRRGLFVVDGSHCRLALLRDRADRPHMGDDAQAPLIDQLHHAMQLWREERRADLVAYLREHQLTDHEPFWNLGQALFEVLPRDEEDWKLVHALLTERESLRIQAGRKEAPALGPLFNGHGTE